MVNLVFILKFTLTNNVFITSLTIALSTSRDAGEQSMFQDHLATTIYHSGAKAWDGVKRKPPCTKHRRTFCTHWRVTDPAAWAQVSSARSSA